MEAVFAWTGPTSDDRLQEPRFCGRCARPLSVRAAVSKTEDPTAANIGRCRDAELVHSREVFASFGTDDRLPEWWENLGNLHMGA